MKKCFFYGIFFCLINTSFAIDMIADISNPVETEFGIYQPFPVLITPQIIDAQPGGNLENVVNLGDFEFDPKSLQMLKSNQFVVTSATYSKPGSEATGFKEMFDVYNDCRENGIPAFVTTDAMLHTFHLCFDYILKTCEEKRFCSLLNTLLDSLLIETQRQYSITNNDVIRSAIISNMDYLIVAKKLLDSTYVEPVNGGKYLEELELIRQANGFSLSPIFDYDEDYSQYIVRGHYTDSEQLSAYFKSMMWLGRMTFACVAPDDEASRQATQRAILLVQALMNVNINDRTALEIWDEIYQPTVFFVGKSDDINFYQYITIAQQVYGVEFSSLYPDAFADDDNLTEFLNHTKEFPVAAITYPGQPIKGFRFMGQRFIPDSWVLDELVMTKIPGRAMPKGLDVMIVLGDEKAFDYLPQEDRNNPFYTEKLDSLVNIFKNYAPEIWAQNVYWNWLYSLMPMLALKGEGYPFYMRTDAWGDKDLLAALASWAELRHDTILYAKQSGSETSMPPTTGLVQGYVEPNPHLFGRLAALASFLQTGLQNKGLLFEEFEFSLNSFYETSKSLKTIAEKELTNESLTAEEYKLIFDFGKTIYRIIGFEQYAEGPSNYDDDIEPMPVVADVHTDGNSLTVLEEGVGFPYAIYVICNIEGRPVLTKGAGYSYYEFTKPLTERMTDEKWRETLQTEPPSPPTWSQSFYVNQDSWINSNPEFSYGYKNETKYLTCDVTPESPAQGDSVEIKVELFGYNLEDDVAIKLTFENGSEMTVDNLNHSSYNLWTAKIPSTNFVPGQVYIDVNISGSGNSPDYRTSFILNSSSIIVDKSVSPAVFQLYQNWPNPFNSQTKIQFDLKKQSYISVVIFDVNGRRLKTVYQGNQGPGQYSLVWDGKDENGSVVCSGVYYYRLETDYFNDIKSMVLLK